MAAKRQAKTVVLREALVAHMVLHGGPISHIKTARDYIAVGVRMMVLKEVAPRGQFQDIVNSLGINVGSASRYIAAARRFQNAPDALLEAVGNASKLKELLSLEDAQVQTLVKGGNVCGVTLESLKTMTVQQLRGALGRKLSGAAVRLTAEEDRMRRRYRQCKPEVRMAVLQMAWLLTDKPGP